LKARTLLLTYLWAERCATSLFRLAAILAATLSVGRALRQPFGVLILCHQRTQVGSPESANVAIPGPLRSFLRMAGISQKVAPEEVMPLLARNVFELGYQGLGPIPANGISYSLEPLRATGSRIGGAGRSDGVINASSCDGAKPLLKILGYRTRPDCGSAARSWRPPIRKERFSPSTRDSPAGT